jgi:4'-phosphopantetheinyl transferase
MAPASHDERDRTAAGSNQSAALQRNTSRLQLGEVAVWWLATDATGPDDWQRWLDMLDREEQDRAARFHFDVDRREFIAAHALLRSMLSFYLQRPAAVWRFATDGNGKPWLAGYTALPEYRFNLSHTRGLVAAAISAHDQLGIDVEKIDRAKADLKVAERYFAPSEIAFLQRTPQAEQPTCFFRFWTLKESYIKAIGTGLGTALDSFAFAFDPIRISFVDAGDEPNRWYFAMLPASDQHVLSVAVGRPPDDVRVVPRALTAAEI